MQKMCKRFMKKMTMVLLLLLLTTIVPGCSAKNDEADVVADVGNDVETKEDTEEEADAEIEVETDVEIDINTEDKDNEDDEADKSANETPDGIVYYDAFGEEITDEMWGQYFNSIDSSYMMSDGVEYMLVQSDGAAGSRYYSLIWRVENGSGWGMVNPNPFMNQGGKKTWIEFVQNDTIGFISITDGFSGNLYRTDDEGETFVELNWPEFTAYSDDGIAYNPFDTPKDVYLEDGKIYLIVGQGLGSYYCDETVGYCDGVYMSEDEGVNWKYVTARSAVRPTQEEYLWFGYDPLE